MIKYTRQMLWTQDLSSPWPSFLLLWTSVWSIECVKPSLHSKTFIFIDCLAVSFIFLNLSVVRTEHVIFPLLNLAFCLTKQSMVTGSRHFQLRVWCSFDRTLRLQCQQQLSSVYSRLQPKSTVQLFVKLPLQAICLRLSPHLIISIFLCCFRNRKLNIMVVSDQLHDKH